MTFEAPERFGVDGRYVRVRELGNGAFAPVWEYADEIAQRPVAVKFLSYARNAMPPLEEIRALANARHPNLVTMHDVMDVCDAAGRSRTAMIMELVDGVSLLHAIRAHGVVEPPRLLAWADQLASALDHLHRTLVHGDLHPGNVLLDQHATRAAIKITDLGTSTRPGEPSIGRFDVQAPESARAASGASDYWALGLLLAQAGSGELLELGRPHEDRERTARAARARALELARTIGHPPTLALIDGLLRLDPAERANRDAVRDAIGGEVEAALARRPLGPALVLAGAAALTVAGGYLAAAALNG